MTFSERRAHKGKVTRKQWAAVLLLGLTASTSGRANVSLRLVLA